MNKVQLLEHLKRQGFSKVILGAFSKVKRENFIPKSLESRAYEDRPLPIGQGATISQPYTIAKMLELFDLKQGQKVLELGSGCGYVLALISEIIREKGKVYGMEIVSELAEKSKENLRDYKNIEIYNRNGRQGLKQEAPFDRILISAAAEKPPKKVLDQLKDKGILIAPIGPRYEQTLTVIQREGKKFNTIKELKGFMFVPFKV